MTPPLLLFLMASYFTHFGAETIGAPPSGWTVIQNGGATVWTVESVAGALAGKALRIGAAGNNLEITWDAPSADPDRENFELLARFRLSGTGTAGNPSLRFQGRSNIGNSLNGYMVRAGWIASVQELGTSLFAQNLPEGEHGLEQADPTFLPKVPYTVGRWIRIRFRILGETLFLKQWLEGEPEPTSWGQEGVDTEHADGDIGLSWLLDAEWEIDWIAVETGGGSAVPAFTASGSIPLSGSGSLSHTATRRSSAKAALRGQAHTDAYWEEDYAEPSYAFGGLLVPRVKRFVSAALSGLGGLTSTGLRRAIGAAALSGSGELELRPLRRLRGGTVTLVGTGSLSAILTLKKIYLKTIALLRSLVINPTDAYWDEDYAAIDYAWRGTSFVTAGTLEAKLGNSIHEVVFAPSQTAVLWRQAVPWTIKEGDTKPTLSATLQETSGDPVDLTGASVRFIMVPQGQTIPKVNKLATIVDAPAGKIEYDWVVADTDTPGKYEVEFEITFADGSRLTCPNATTEEVNVVKQLGSAP